MDTTSARKVVERDAVKPQDLRVEAELELGSGERFQHNDNSPADKIERRGRDIGEPDRAGRSGPPPDGYLQPAFPCGVLHQTFS